MESAPRPTWNFIIFPGPWSVSAASWYLILPIQSAAVCAASHPYTATSVLLQGIESRKRRFALVPL
ncbi:hypothetical protein K491DRAFT_686085 [Lophiostoma macrostomum CBS 122681]|uniref:Uncharacterized protein n=1 Tax=Lophiostoma macrostomum CBS 122681 TaxID=1314788 RepID=A0A6A6TSY2_9PLEO|nr:hypothetical protein K491DRAFT_686085 [Lophiostoma macrostomum CBS 122681]